MPQAHFQPGESFHLQFAWKLPNGDYLRAVFKAVVVDLVPNADKYIVLLTELIAGRQESDQGFVRELEAYSTPYWGLVGGLVDRKITIAYEADDSRAVHLRLETLTGEHNFFSRYEDAEVIAKGLAAASRKRDQDQK